MPNLVGIGNSQVPTNAMLGGLAYQDSVGEINLDKIKARTGNTAKDIFVYDTRKDSDGGAWRHRTQNTSWYNESVSSIRGARKEFPAVAIIVVEASQVTIFDGDDPNCSMWMRFNQSTIGLGAMVGYTTFSIGCCTMVNGILMVGMDASNQANVAGLRLINFISEHFNWKANITGRNSSLHWPIIDRNDGHVNINIDSNLIVNEVINDVAVTVLPNAPIDASTGLPVPTIAVATDGGFSIIKDDGTVIDKVVSSTVTNKVDWYKGQYLLGTGPEYWALYKDLSEASSGYISGTADLYSAANQNSWDKPQPTGKETKVVAVGDVIAGGSETAYTGHVPGLSLKIPPSGLKNGNSSLLCEIRKDFNTGWMVGDIKGAFLSDTDATNVTGTEYVTNGDFSTGDLTGWTQKINGSGSLSVNGSNQAVIVSQNSSNQTELQQSVTVPKGVDLIYSFTVVSGSIYNGGWASNNRSSGTYSFVFNIAGTGNQTINLWYTPPGWSGTVVIDNISIRHAEQDRSVHGGVDLNAIKKGLQVFGTITKTPVATGAELVAYSGFNSSNYLFQPHNTDLEFGTDDYSVMLWYKPGTGSIDSREIFANLRGSTNHWVLSKEYTNKFVFDTVTDPNNRTLSVWNHVCGVRDNGIAKLYVNGDLVGSAAANDNINDTSDGLIIGQNPDNNDWRTRGSLALLKISASAASAEQVKKIFDDEKCLYHENAKCTLHGTSNEIKALAFDDTNGILHAGTSAGRSEFQGLNRINNTTTAVTTAISASNGLVAEQ